MRRSRRWVTLLTIAFACMLSVASLLVWGISAIGRDVDERLTLYRATVLVNTSEPFLSEAEALRLAEQAMIAAGYPPTEWRPLENGSTAPDGRRDEFISRNAYDPNRVIVQYRHPTRNNPRDVLVAIERAEDGYRVRVSRGK